MYGKIAWNLFQKSSKLCSYTPSKLFKRGSRIFSVGGGSLVIEEFLKKPVGNSNTYDLKLENAMSEELNVMIVQTL